MKKLQLPERKKRVENKTGGQLKRTVGVGEKICLERNRYSYLLLND